MADVVETPAGFPDNPYNPCCWIRGEPEIGDGTWIGAFTLIDGTGGLKIGRGCDISSGAHVLSHSSARRCVSERRVTGIRRLPTVIEDHVFVGTNAVILMGCHVGHHSVIGAGAVLREGTRVPPYSLVVGVPARIVRDIRDEIETWVEESENISADEPA